MQKRTLVLAVIGLVLGLSGGVSNAISIINPGFETGNFSGWTLYVPYGASANVVTTHSGNYQIYSAQEGQYFAQLKTDGPGSYTTASQSFSLAVGQTVSGQAAFDYRDYHYYNDSAYVRIYDSGGQLMATPWSVFGNNVPNYWDGPWTTWSWTAAVAGTYTLQYRIVNGTDSVEDSFALFDATSISAAPGVPDGGSTLILLGVALAFLRGVRSRRPGV